MIHGLRITIDGDALRERIAERITQRQATFDALEARIAERAGDQRFDVRLDAHGDIRSFGELQDERDRLADTLRALTLLRDTLDPAETYALGQADLRLADLIPVDTREAEEPAHPHDAPLPSFIDGLLVTMTGRELRQRLEERAAEHRRRAADWKHEQSRTADDQTDDEPLLPDHLCENEAEQDEWRAEVLGFIHAHIDLHAVYRLNVTDLEFGELLPEKPGWLAQQDYEERTGVAFQLERLKKELRARRDFPDPEPVG